MNKYRGISLTRQKIIKKPFLRFKFYNMKKVFSFFVLMAAAVTMFIATQSVDQSKDVKLANLATLTNANAECFVSVISSFNTGHCSFSGNCFEFSGAPDCSSSGGF
jgi:hypothetical protein